MDIAASTCFLYSTSCRTKDAGDSNVAVPLGRSRIQNLLAS